MALCGWQEPCCSIRTEGLHGPGRPDPMGLGAGGKVPAWLCLCLPSAGLQGWGGCGQPGKATAGLFIVKAVEEGEQEEPQRCG